MSKTPKNKDVNKLYLGLMKSPVLLPELQERIFKFGVAERDYRLLAALTAHPSLEKSLEGRLRKVNSSTVLAVWLNRPGRTPDEIATLVAKERRPKILNELLEMDGLPQSIYAAVAAQSSGKEPLIKIITDDKFSTEIRVSALFRLAKVANAEAKNTSDVNFDLAMDSFPEYAEQISASTESLALKLSSLAAGELSDEQRNSILRCIHRKLESDIKASERELQAAQAKGGSYSYNISRITQWLPQVASRLAQKAGFDEKLVGEIISLAQIAQDTMVKVNRWRTSVVLDAIADLRTAAGPKVLQPNYQDAIATCKSEKQLQEILEKIKKLNSGINTDMALLAVAGSPLATAKTVLKAVASVSYPRQKLVPKVVRNPKMYAATLSRNSWCVEDKALEKSDDPSSVYLELATTYVDKFTGERNFLGRSEYLTPDLIGKVSPRVFLKSDSLSQEITDALQALFLAEIKNAEQWSLFESLAPSFEGTLDELLHMINIG